MSLQAPGSWGRVSTAKDCPRKVAGRANRVLGEKQQSEPPFTARLLPPAPGHRASYSTSLLLLNPPVSSTWCKFYSLPPFTDGENEAQGSCPFPEDAEQPRLYLLPCKVGTSDTLCPSCPGVAAAQVPLSTRPARDSSPPHVLPPTPPAQPGPLSVLCTVCTRQGNGLCLS